MLSPSGNYRGITGYTRFFHCLLVDMSTTITNLNILCDKDKTIISLGLGCFERMELASGEERIASSIAHPGCRWRDTVSVLFVFFPLSVDILSLL